MAQQEIDVGSSAGDDTGDPLRDAFTKINENFAELYSGNVQVTSANVLVYSVAGRTGNVVLTVNDITQAASKSYVDTAISANIAIITGSVTNSLSANITAANIVIDNHESRITTLENNAEVQSAAIDILDNTKATITYVDQSIDLALSSNAILSDVILVNANVAAANINVQNNSSNISILFANAATQTQLINSINSNISAVNLSIGLLQSNAINQENSLTMLRANINAANAVISAISVDSLNANISAANLSIVSLQSNAAAQALELDALASNAGIQATSINLLQSNAAAQAVSINLLNTNIADYWIYSNTNAASQATSINLINNNLIAANLQIASLLANASIQSLELDNLQSNAQAQQGNIISLQANSAIQAVQIGLLNSNLDAANTSISILFGTAGKINLINANVTAANLNIAALQSNAATQALDINYLYANISQGFDTVITNSANIVAINAAIQVLDANLGSTTTNVSILQENVDLQTTQITLLNANIAAANIIKADLSGAIFSGNVQVDYLLANSDVKIGSILEVGDVSPVAYPGLGAVFVANTDGYYQVVIQNTNNGPNSSGDFVITADDGTDTNNYINIGINSSGFNGNFIVPAGDTGLSESPHDGYLSTIGGNTIVRSDGNVYLIANTSAAVLNKDGDFALITGNLRFKDNTVQHTGNIGALSYFPNNSANYNETVTNIQQALDELAARLRALGG